MVISPVQHKAEEKRTDELRRELRNGAEREQLIEEALHGGQYSTAAKRTGPGAFPWVLRFPGFHCPRRFAEDGGSRKLVRYGPGERGHYWRRNHRLRDRAGAFRALEIGRASCRERV